jgi:hypothetical protein
VGGENNFPMKNKKPKASTEAQINNINDRLNMLEGYGPSTDHALISIREEIAEIKRRIAEVAPIIERGTLRLSRKSDCKYLGVERYDGNHWAYISGSITAMPSFWFSQEQKQKQWALDTYGQKSAILDGVYVTQ